MTSRRIDVTFSHEGDPLTYGPSVDDTLAHIIGSIESQTGGYLNVDYVTHPSYRLVFFIPPVAFAYLELAGAEAFIEAVNLRWWQDRVGLSGIRVERGA